MPWDDRLPQGGFTKGEPWLPLLEGHRQRAVSVQQTDPASVLNAYRAMVRLRRAQPALRWGSMRLLPSADGIVAFVREHYGQSLLAAFNFSSDRVQLALPPDTRVEALVLPGHDLGKAGAAVVELPPAGVFFGVLRSI
jgi:alpha-glucosidase